MTERAVGIKNYVFFHSQHGEVLSAEIAESHALDVYFGTQISIFQRIVAEPASLEGDAAGRETVHSEIADIVAT